MKIYYGAHNAQIPTRYGVSISNARILKLVTVIFAPII